MTERGHETDVPLGFVRELQRMTIFELAMMRQALTQYPEDALFLAAANREIKRRATQVPAHISDETP